MTDDIVVFQHDIDHLQRPLLVTAFKDLGGQTASAIVEFLIDAWDADELAVIDPDPFYNFTQNRPHARLRDGQRVIDWPTLRLHRARPRTASGAPFERDILFFHGPEPSFQWKALSDAVIQSLRGLGVEELLSIATFQGATPHTRPTPLWMTATDRALAEPFGVEIIDPQYQGPVGFSGTLNTLLRQAGLRTASLIAITPFYLGEDPSPQAGLALLQALARGWNLDLDLRDAEQEADAFLATTSDLVRRAGRLQQVVDNLETQYDSNPRQHARPQLPSTPLPPSDELLADVEQFLRSQQTDNPSD